MRLTSDPHGHFAGKDFVVIGEVMHLRLFYDETDPPQVRRPAVVVANDMHILFDAKVCVSHADDGASIEIVFESVCSNVRVTLESGDTLCVQSYPFDVVETVRFVHHDDTVRSTLAHVVRQNDDLKARLSTLMLMFVKMCDVVATSTGVHQGIASTTTSLGKRRRPSFQAQ